MKALYNHFITNKSKMHPQHQAPTHLNNLPSWSLLIPSLLASLHRKQLQSDSSHIRAEVYWALYSTIWANEQNIGLCRPRQYHGWTMPCSSY